MDIPILVASNIGPYIWDMGLVAAQQGKFY